MSELTATSLGTATKAKPYVCTTCTRPFARLEHLKRHERSHTKEKPFCCEQSNNVPGCGRRFARRDLLLRHQQKIHLFPNTSKRRRLSSVSQVSNKSATPANALPPTTSDREQFTISIPNLDDLTNFENGTVNPSSIYSTSPPASAHSNTVQHFMDAGMTPNLGQHNAGEYSYATEKLLPADMESNMASESSFSNHSLWPLPELSLNIASPSSTISSHYSPSGGFCSLGGPSALQMAGSDSELFSPDFFISSGYMSNPMPVHHHRSKSESLPHSASQSQSQAQLFITSQLEQMAHRRATSFHVPDDSHNPSSSTLQFLGGDQAYCNGYRPDTSYNAGFVETF